jgi:hypothetical protein
MISELNIFENFFLLCNHCLKTKIPLKDTFAQNTSVFHIYEKLSLIKVQIRKKLQNN